MSYNVGRTERVSRLLIALVLLGVGFFHVLTGILAILAYVLGGIALVTGLAGFFPAWARFGIDTCPVKCATVGGSGQ
jgi:hypothetical protein